MNGNELHSVFRIFFLECIEMEYCFFAPFIELRQKYFKRQFFSFSLWML